MDHVDADDPVSRCYRPNRMRRVQGNGRAYIRDARGLYPPKIGLATKGLPDALTHLNFNLLGSMVRPINFDSIFFIWSTKCAKSNQYGDSLHNIPSPRQKVTLSQDFIA